MKQIQPKLNKAAATPSAVELEASFQALAQTEKPAPPLKKSKPTAPAAAKRTSRTPEVPAKRDGKTRLTVDIPDALYTRIEKHKEESGQNFTHLIVSLLNKHFQEK